MLKADIREWNKTVDGKLDDKKKNILSKLEELDRQSVKEDEAERCRQKGSLLKEMEEVVEAAEIP